MKSFTHVVPFFSTSRCPELDVAYFRKHGLLEKGIGPYDEDEEWRGKNGPIALSSSCSMKGAEVKANYSEDRKHLLSWEVYDTGEHKSAFGEIE